MTALDESGILLVLLGELYCQFVNDEVDVDETISLIELLDRCRLVLEGRSTLSRNMSYFAAKSGQSDGLIEIHDEEHGVRYMGIKITYKGLQTVKAALAIGEQPISDYCTRRQSFSFLDPQTAEMERVPSDASPESEEDLWAPLPVDRDSTDYKKALVSLEAARDEFRGENGFASQEPEKKAAVLAALDHGIDVFKSMVLTRATLESFLLQPLRFIAKTFGTASVAEAAKLAVAALKNLFGL